MDIFTTLTPEDVPPAELALLRREVLLLSEGELKEFLLQMISALASGSTIYLMSEKE